MLMANKTVLVTGTASGIGRETALLAAQEGAARIACIDVHDENNEATAHELEKMGATAIPHNVDLGDVDPRRAEFKNVADECGGPDARPEGRGVGKRGGSIG